MPIFKFAPKSIGQLLALIDGMGEIVDLDQQFLVFGTKLLVVYLQALGAFQLSLPEVPLCLPVLSLAFAGRLVDRSLAPGFGSSR